MKVKVNANDTTKRKDKVEFSGGTSIPTVIFINFLILKLANLVTWSWWIIFSPLIIYIVGIIVLISIVLTMDLDNTKKEEVK